MPRNNPAPAVSNLMNDEPELIARCRHGEAEAFETLIRRHQQEVFAVALRMLGDRSEAEDVAQDAFVRAYQGIGAFRAEAKLSTWLVSITMNLCRNRRRWWARRRQLITASLDAPLETEEGEVAPEPVDPSPTPDVEAQRRERERQLMGALQRLDQSDRMMVVLRDLEGRSYEEIGRIVGCPLGTVKSRLSRARWQLRALLDGKL